LRTDNIFYDSVYQQLLVIISTGTLLDIENMLL